MLSISSARSVIFTLNRSSIRLLRTSPVLSQKSITHTTDSYSKDVDSTPPPDPTIHVVDSAHVVTEVQRPHDSPANRFSQTGAKAALDSAAGKEKLQYGNRSEWVELKGAETSHPGEGPEGSSKGGRHPEGRS